MPRSDALGQPRISILLHLGQGVIAESHYWGTGALLRSFRCQAHLSNKAIRCLFVDDWQLKVGGPCLYPGCAITVERVGLGNGVFGADLRFR